MVLDEAHERTLHTDVLLGLLKRLAERGAARGAAGPLRLVIMSATLDAAAFTDYFAGARAVYVQGRQFPVQARVPPSCPPVHPRSAWGGYWGHAPACAWGHLSRSVIRLIRIR